MQKEYNFATALASALKKIEEWSWGDVHLSEHEARALSQFIKMMSK